MKKGKGKQQGLKAEGGSTNSFQRGLWAPEAATRAPQGLFSCLPPTMALQMWSLPFLPFQKENFTEIRERKALCPKSCLSIQ